MLLGYYSYFPLPAVFQSFIPLIQHQFFLLQAITLLLWKIHKPICFFVISHITEIAVSDFLVPDNFEDFFPVQLTC